MSDFIAQTQARVVKPSGEETSAAEPSYDAQAMSESTRCNNGDTGPDGGQQAAMEVQAPIHIHPYDASWPAQFEFEKATLVRMLDRWIEGGIEHVGSTAVVGLCAKPVIDVMVGVRSLADSVPARDTLIAAGYQYAAYKTKVMHWLCKPSFAMRTHHIHLVPFGSPLWRERLAFRDLLRRDRAVADEYARLKLELAEKFEHDREAYTDAKWPFIHRMLSQVGLGTRGE